MVNKEATTPLPPQDYLATVPVEITPKEEKMLQRIDTQAAVEIGDVNDFIELGITTLEVPTAGTSMQSGSERANRQYRGDYLRRNLGIDTTHVESIHGPLSERLVNDVAFDFIGLCMTVKDLLKTHDYGAASVEIELFNALAKFRQLKDGRSMEITSTGESRHQRGMRFQSSVGRSDNAAAPGEFAAILKTVLIGLKRKQLVVAPQA